MQLIGGFLVDGRLTKNDNYHYMGTNMKDKIIQTIESTINNYEAQNYQGKIWKEPIIEIISANNKELSILKEAVSSEHLTPSVILPDAKSIISFFIPFSENIVKSNIDGTMASKEWVTAYIKTNDLIKIINDEIELLMLHNGYKAGKIPATHNFDVNKLISNWSHRHIAYIAGIGTFGINNMLITRNGCCGRLGSIIVNYELSEYRQIGKREEKCLKKRNGSCGICQQRCIVNAYTDNKFDRHKCYRQCLMNDDYHDTNGNALVCGKCLVNLPCSVKEP